MYDTNLNGAAIYCLILIMCQAWYASLIKVQSWVFTAKCSELQAGISNGISVSFLKIVIKICCY